MMDFGAKLRALFARGAEIGASFYDELFDDLVEGDFAPALAVKLLDAVRERAKREKAANGEAVRLLLRAELEAILAPGAVSPPRIPPDDDGLSLMLLLGVNGVGKTTSAAKLARYYAAASPILAAADTFRAAAIDQLKIHGERLGKRVVAHQHGSDPAAVLFDALEAASAGDCRLVIADTAGRMHTKTALVEELKKIDRVVTKFTEKEGARNIHYYKYLVLDATTGSNAAAQAEVFTAALKSDGAILTKYDSSAKGGIVFTLASLFHLPVLFLCTGEGYDDIHPFDAASFVRDFVG